MGYGYNNGTGGQGANNGRANPGNFNNNAGFGLQNTDPNSWKIAAEAAMLPDSDLTSQYMNQAMPEGQMVSGHYVAPSWTQQLDAGLKRAAGTAMYQKGTAGRQAIVDYLRSQGKIGVPAEQMPGETMGQQGLANPMNPQTPQTFPVGP